MLDIGQVAAPAAALVAALGGLAAATGLEEVQRNHAVLFVLALVFATLSAILVAVAGRRLRAVCIAALQAFSLSPDPNSVGKHLYSAVA